MANPHGYRLRYSLASLAAVIALASIGLAALKHSNPWWAIGLVYLTFLMFLTAAAWAVHGRSVFGSGFALGGFAWLVLVFVFSQSGLRDPDNWIPNAKVDAEGRLTGYTKGPYSIDDNPLHPNQVCQRLASIFRDPKDGFYMREEAYRCFRVEAYCIAGWLCGLFTGGLCLLISIRRATR
jgi:hypothetical protein